MSAARQHSPSAITLDPLVLHPTMRRLGILRGQLHLIQSKADITDIAFGELIAECIAEVDSALVEEIRRANDPNSDLAIGLRQSLRLNAVEMDLAAIEKHLGILAINGKIIHTNGSAT